MEATVGLLDVDFLTEDGLVWVSPPQVVDEMKEPAERMTLDRLGHVGDVDTLVDGFALFAVVGEVVREAFLGYRFA